MINVYQEVFILKSFVSVEAQAQLAQLAQLTLATSHGPGKSLSLTKLSLTALSLTPAVNHHHVPEAY